MLVNAIGNVNFSAKNVNFSARNKENKYDTNLNATNTLKAVPLAVLLAMSPLNPVDVSGQNHKTLMPEEAFELAQYGKVLSEAEFKDASKLYGDCVIRYIDTDNDDKTIEFAELKFFNTNFENFSAYAKIYPEVLVEDKNGFWVQGNGDRRLYYDPDNIHEREDRTKIAVPVTERFFNVLLNIYGNELPVIRDKGKAYPISF